MLSSVPRYAPQLVALDMVVNIVPTSIESVSYQFMLKEKPADSPPTLMGIESVFYQSMVKETLPEQQSTAMGIEFVYFQYMVRA